MYAWVLGTPPSKKFYPALVLRDNEVPLIPKETTFDCSVLYAINALIGAAVFHHVWDGICVYSRATKSNIGQALASFVHGLGMHINSFSHTIFPYQTLTKGTKLLQLERGRIHTGAQLQMMRDPGVFNFICSGEEAKCFIMRIDSLQIFKSDLTDREE